MYFKILSNDLNHRGFQYCEGLNVDTNPFDTTPDCGGGLFFTDEENIMAFADYGDKIAVVEVPEGEQIVRVENKYKTHSVILKGIRDLWTVETMEWLKDLNINFHVCNEWVFCLACENGHLEVAKWLYGLGDVNIHICNESVFCYACAGGHLEVAKWLHGLGEVDIHADSEYAFRWACENDHLEVAKWLYSLGNIDIPAKNNWLFEYVENSEVLEFLREISKGLSL